VVAVAAYLVGMGGRWATSDPPPEPLAPIEAPRGAPPSDPGATAAVASPQDPVPGAPGSASAPVSPSPGDPADPVSAAPGPGVVPGSGANPGSPAPGSGADPAADPAEPGPASANPSADPVQAPVPADPVPAASAEPVRPDPTDAVAVAPRPDPTPPIDGLTLLRGKWTGEAGGRRCELRFVSCDGSAVRAELVFVAGTETTSRPLSGTFDRTNGALTLKGDGRIEFRGTLSGDTIRGTYSQGGARTLDWSVSR
jgi:hypothetical protein